MGHQLHMLMQYLMQAHPESENTWNELGGSMKIFVTYRFHPKLHFNPTPLHPLVCL